MSNSLHCISAESIESDGKTGRNGAQGNLRETPQIYTFHCHCELTTTATLSTQHCNNATGSAVGLLKVCHDCYERISISGGYKGRRWGRPPPHWLIFLSKIRFFPCKRHIFRCAHLR